MIKIAIIGSAGRKEDKALVTPAIWKKMVNDVYKQIKIAEEGQLVHLISGGAAFADHLAVEVWENPDKCYVQELTLYFPSQWDSARTQFVGNKDAQTANYYHELFSSAIYGHKFGSREMINQAIIDGAKAIPVMEGFKARNLLVGQADVLITYTDSRGPLPKPGGTYHTWMNSKAIKIHRDIRSL